MQKDIERLVHIPAGLVTLEGALNIPEGAKGIVLFAHGSGSSRHSRRNNFVAQVLRAGGLGTLLLDLLTEKEDTVYENRFDIDLLTNRLVAATTWFQEQPEATGVSIGYFGASTGAAAALSAAAELGTAVSAVVSRGGRPDLAASALDRVDTATLLLVGSNDDVVIELNQYAYERIRSVKELVIIPGASHLFEEPGTLEEVASLATAWFRKHLVGE